MRGREFQFYATKSDLISALAKVEARRLLKYDLIGSLADGERRSYASALDIPDLGVASEKDSIGGAHYLVTDRDTPVYWETVHLYSGETRSVIEPSGNEVSIVLKAGGICPNVESFTIKRRHGTGAIIQGSISTSFSDNAGSMALFRSFQYYLKKTFLNIDGHWVGAEALELHRGGFRLTSNSTVRFFDIHLDDEVPSVPGALPNTMQLVRQNQER